MTIMVCRSNKEWARKEEGSCWPSFWRHGRWIMPAEDNAKIPAGVAVRNRT
jgi:hypothetical protein